MAWTGSFVVTLWGRSWFNDDGAEAMTNGASYELLTDTWATFPHDHVPGEVDGYVRCAGRIFASSGAALYRHSPEDNRDQRMSDAPVSSLPILLCDDDHSLVVVGSNAGPDALPRVLAYRIQADEWETLSLEPNLTPRTAGGAALGGRHLYLYGGYDPTTQQPLAAGERADLETGNVTQLSDVDAPSPRVEPHVAWTGDELIVWGGKHLWDGAIYSPNDDSWRYVSEPAVPLQLRYAARVVRLWLGQHLFVYTRSGDAHVGGLFDPETDSWHPVGLGPHYYWGEAVWTGEEVVLHEGSGAIWSPPISH